MDKEDQKQEIQLPESPASVNTRMKSPRGFVYQWTMRDEKNSTLLHKVLEMEKKWLELGFTPVEGYQNAPKYPVKEKKECPVHKGVMMTEKASKQAGSKYFSHSKGVYPNFGEWCNGKGYLSEFQNEVDQDGNNFNDSEEF